MKRKMKIFTYFLHSSLFLNFNQKWNFLLHEIRSHSSFTFLSCLLVIIGRKKCEKNKVSNSFYHLYSNWDWIFWVESFSFILYTTQFIYLLFKIVKKIVQRWREELWSEDERKLIIKTKLFCLVRLARQREP